MTRDSTPVRYQIRPARPEAHVFEIACSIARPNPVGQVLSLPAWIPGSYMIRDFAKHVLAIRAHCDLSPLPIEQLDKQSWRCAPCAGPLTVKYQVYAWDLSVRAAHLDTTHAFFNGTSVFLQAQGFERSPHSVRILPPEGKEFADWRVATSLPRADAEPFGFGGYRASNYEELVDHPVEMGRFAQARFVAGGTPHHLVITGRQRADLQRLSRDLAQICQHHVDFWGELPPMDQYLFLTLAVDEGYGGLEHRDSCSLLCSRDDLPRSGDDEVSKEYARFLGLCSHEYFHLWNVKRIQPAAFVDPDLCREVHTRQLWVFEGITSYYDDLALVRCGLIPPARYLGLLAETFSRVLRGSGRFRQSLADSSFDAWTKFYKQDENAPNAIVSYYAKGALVALALDLTIRRDSEDRHSLDDVMRALWQRHGRTREGVAEDDFERIVRQVTGLDLKGFFDAAVRGTDDQDWAGLLSTVGIGFRMRSARDASDKGGYLDKPVEPPKTGSSLGVVLAANGNEARLAQVLDDGAAQAAGLAAGDILIAVDDLQVQRQDLEKRIARLPPGEPVTIHLFRRGELMAFSVYPLPAPADTCDLWLEPEADALQRREAWLGNRA